ncbi:MAG TPA: DUF4301 family protein [Syntrophales bacterium]|nr:DUF4301 family protein [Syntrophales bacterium]
MVFAETDIKRIEREGLTCDQVLAQINLFKKGIHPVKLNRPCTVNDGIVTFPEEELREMAALYEENLRMGRKVLKFVPASGAASRMFKDWYVYMEQGTLDSRQSEEFVRELKRFAFYNDLSDLILREGEDIEQMLEDERYAEILAYMLTSKGLKYGDLPKALLKFHAYPDGSRSALEEHLVEAALYLKDACRICRLHFTLSEEHREDVAAYLSVIKRYYEKHYGVIFDIALSTQKSSTNTIAVDLDNRPFRDQQGEIVFRPGGHGALLDNLNGTGGDIIYLKNIDNIVPDRLKAVTVFYKKVLGGYLISLQNEIFAFLRHLDDAGLDEKTLQGIKSLCEKRLNIVFPPQFEDLSLSEKGSFIFNRLNRPIRVCGMVKNQGEPGGGPFWVNEEDQTQSLQIVEESQINSGSAEQRAVWFRATHFNPVDLVCGVRNYRSCEFDLHDFVDKDAYFISQKSEKGRDLKALELPGLWNGSMAFWITVFVEVPIETFNPVKTIRDLLRPQHLP